MACRRRRAGAPGGTGGETASRTARGRAAAHERSLVGDGLATDSPLFLLLVINAFTTAQELPTIQDARYPDLSPEDSRIGSPVPGDIRVAAEDGIAGRLAASNVHEADWDGRDPQIRKAVEVLLDALGERRRTVPAQASPDGEASH